MGHNAPLRTIVAKSRLGLLAAVASVNVQEARLWSAAALASIRCRGGHRNGRNENRSGAESQPPKD